MGQTLSQPDTNKVSSSCENLLLKAACSCMQGWRISMEDAHTMALSLGGEKERALFGVFDGHGGRRVADYASKHLHHRIANHDAYLSGDVVSAMRGAYMGLDSEMFGSPEFASELAGTTAVTVLITPQVLYCANVGDSRAVLCVSGHCVPLSHDHKPSQPEEQQRIQAAGGWIEFNRVNGNLALSRALGDFSFKRNKSKPAEEQIVTANPEISSCEMTKDAEFLVIACDGIWDVLTNGEVIEFCRKRVMMQMDPARICEELMDQCLAPDCHMGGLGCDNMTVQLICFLHGEPYSQLATRCSYPPAKLVPPVPVFV